MKFNKIYTSVLLLTLINGSTVFAGNKDRAGQAGATELNINPWATSNGLSMSNGSTVKGLEACKLNIAGLSRLEKLEVGVSFNQYLLGSGVSYAGVGIAKKSGDDAAFSVNIMSMNFGNPYLSTVEDPESMNTYNPSFLIIGLGYAKEFSDNVSAGFQANIVSENFEGARATAVGFDAGIQYKSGNNDNTHFAVTLRNVGPAFKFAGSGLTYRADIGTTAVPAEKVDLPSSFTLSGAYDYYPGISNDKKFEKGFVPKSRLTTNFAFVANAFFSDYLALGLEYASHENLFFRAGYRYEQNIFSSVNSQTLYNGVSAGLGFKTGFGEDKSTKVKFDYGFRMARSFSGVHTVSVLFDIN